MLEQKSIDVKDLNLDKLKLEYQALLSQKSELSSVYHDNSKNMKDLNRKLANLKQYLGEKSTTKKEEIPEKPEKNRDAEASPFPKPLAKITGVVYNQIRNRKIFHCPTVKQSETL